MRLMLFFFLALLHHDVSAALSSPAMGPARANVERAARAEQQRATAQLWISIRKNNQNALADQILDKVTQTEFANWKIEKRPVQLVSAVPPRTELRYFKKQDYAHAKELFNRLHKLIPDLELRDYSVKYEKSDWIKPGHFELWISPALTRLQPQ